MKISLLLVFVLLCVACAQKHQHHDDKPAESDREWKEMDEYHTIMADAFHPYMDSANLEPAKQKAPELLAAANKWKDSALPEKVDNDEIKAKLEKLVTLSATLNEEVKKGNDETTGKVLNELHDLFHELQNDWYGASHGDDHHEHHEH